MVWRAVSLLLFAVARGALFDGTPQPELPAVGFEDQVQFSVFSMFFHRVFQNARGGFCFIFLRFVFFPSFRENARNLVRDRSKCTKSRLR